MSDHRTPSGRRLGWNRPLWNTAPLGPTYRPPRRLLAALPSSVDLRNGSMPPVFDQGNLGSCTANAVAGALYYDENAEQVAGAFMPSRLFSYYNSRVIEGDPTQDGGATIADAVKAVVQWGYAPESVWPYDISQFATKPPPAVYTAAAKDLITDYAAVNQSPDQLKAALAAGHPVIYGFDVFPSYENVGSDGMLSTDYSGGILGGHANVLVGYNDATQRYVTRNSWGTGWGAQGYAYQTYAFIHGQHASDFWVINTVPGGSPAPTPIPTPTPTPTPVAATIFTAAAPNGFVAGKRYRLNLTFTALANGAGGNYSLMGPVTAAPGDAEGTCSEYRPPRRRR